MIKEVNNKYELQIFSNSEFGELAIIEVDGKPYFPATRCAEVLGYANPRKAIIDHCKGVTKCDSLSEGGVQSVNFIPEGDLYRLIVRSKLPAAEKFERWIFDEVLPQIRKTGGYVNNDDLFISTYLPLANEQTKLLFKSTLSVINNLNGIIKEQKPLVEFAETVANTSDTIDIGQLAKLVHDENIPIGRNKLFEWLRQQKFLRKNNEPYQKFIENEWFKIVEKPYSTPHGDKINIKTLVTGKGQIAIVEKLRKAFCS